MKDCELILILIRLLFVASCITPCISTFQSTLPSTSSKGTLLAAAAAAAAAETTNHPDEGEDQTSELRFLFHHGVYDQRKPSRAHDLPPLKDVHFFSNWGIEHYHSNGDDDDDDPPSFPTTVDAVATEAWRAIAATIYRKQRLDPNESSNAMTGSIHGYRPVRKQHDVGRIGIEIDGPKHLYPNHAVTDNDAVRRVALKLAVKLSQGPWDGFENDNTNTNTKPFHRPVAVYFNTIKQSLVASQEMNLLRRASNEKSHVSLEQIMIKTLGQDKTIPTHMKSKMDTRHRGLHKGTVDPTQGMLIIVQPTDYNDEFRPPGPAIGALGDLQQLTARAAAENLIVIVLSPRFLVMDHGHWDQSGYQQSSTFGGAEPAKGPTPWVLRDFTPPAYCWVGNGVAGKTKIGLTQSVLHENHAWHVFCSGTDRQYKYLASTKTSSGRPTAQIMKLIYEEWAA